MTADCLATRIRTRTGTRIRTGRGPRRRPVTNDRSLGLLTGRYGRQHRDVRLAAAHYAASLLDEGFPMTPRRLTTLDAALALASPIDRLRARTQRGQHA